MRRTAWIILTLGCRLSAFAAIAVSLVGGRGLVVAQDARPTMQVEVGFDGYCRSDAWCPVYTVLSNESADVEGELRIVVGSVSGGDEPNVYVRPVVLPAHSRKAYFLNLPSTSVSSRLRLTVQVRQRLGHQTPEDQDQHRRHHDERGHRIDHQRVNPGRHHRIGSLGGHADDHPPQRILAVGVHVDRR